jgi:thioesterase domain-containing protein/Ser-tRNA(Ala) deacylase AlaX
MTEPTGDRLRLLRRRLAGAPAATAPRPRAARGAGRLPASEQQRALWFLDQLIGAGRNSAYNVNVVLRLRGALDEDAVRRALTGIVRRHESLRTTFEALDGEPVQVVRAAAPVSVEHVGSERDLFAVAARPFDLNGGSLFRAVLAPAGEGHVLFLGFHHAVFDGASVAVLLDEFAALYQGATLPELTCQYADYALWQRDRIAQGAFERDLDEWRKRLDGAPALTSWPADRPRPDVPTYAGAELRVPLPGEVITGLRDWARGEHASLFMVLFAAFQVLLARASGRTDLCVGTPVAGRSHPDFVPLIGYFVNTLVLRGDLSGSPTFREFVRRVRDDTLTALDHQELPFDRLVEQLQPDRSAGRSPLVQTLFAVQESALAVTLPGLDVRVDDLPGNSAKFDLTAVIWPEDGEWVLGIEYAIDLYRPSTIERMAAAYRAVLAEVLADPDRPLLLPDPVAAAGPAVASPAPSAVPPAASPAAPATDTERHLAEIWSALLGVDDLDRNTDLFSRGAHSFLVMRALSRIRHRFGASLPASAVFQDPTIAGMARRLDRGVGYSPLVRLADGGPGRPLILVHPVGGSTACYAGLAGALSGQRPVLGLVARGLDGAGEPLESVEEMAATYLAAIRGAGHEPPYTLGGWSMGGVVAYEMARQLAEPVPLLFIDSYPPDQLWADHDDPQLLAWFAEDLGETLGVDLGVTAAALEALREPERLGHLLAAARAAGAVTADAESADLAGLAAVFAANLKALSRYRPTVAGIAGPIAVLAAADGPADGSGPDHGWAPVDHRRRHRAHGPRRPLRTPARAEPRDVRDRRAGKLGRMTQSLTFADGTASNLIGAVSGTTVVTFPSGATRGESPVVGAVLTGGLLGLVTGATPFHPVDHRWPDHPADTGVITIDGATYPVVDCVLGAKPDGADVCLLGTDIPVRAGEPGWTWLVVHLVEAPDVAAADLVGRTATLAVDEARRAGLSAGHTACELVTLAVNQAMADRWRKEFPLDPLGSPDFDKAAITTSRIHVWGSRDEYRLGKSLRKKGFVTEGLADDLDALAARITQQMTAWVTAAAPVSIGVDGPGLTEFRTWRCSLPEGAVVVPCGGTHVRNTAELGAVTVRLELDGTSAELAMITTVAPAGAAA